MYENIWHLFGKGRIIKSFLYSYGERCPSPDVFEFASGKLYFSNIQDYVTVCVVKEGLHIRRFGLFSVLIKWSCIDVLVESSNKGMQLCFKNQVEDTEGQLFIPWNDSLSKLFEAAKSEGVKLNLRERKAGW